MLHLVSLLNQEIIANAWGFLYEVIENALEELRHFFFCRECTYDVVSIFGFVSIEHQHRFLGYDCIL